MTVKSIAVAVAQLLQADDIERTLATPDAQSDADVATLVSCINTAAADISVDLPISITQTAMAVCGEIPYASLSRRPSTVRRADNDGPVVFECGQSGILVPRDGPYEVTYTVEPEQRGLDEQPDVSPLCDRSMLTYLAARNYCLVMGRNDEAAVWDQLYDAHSTGKRLARRARLAVRAWG